MNGRVLGTELRRSAAPWAGVVIAGGALAFLYLIDGMWWRGTVRWTSQWTSMALLTRTLLFYLWPVAVGIGALQGLRDSRSRMTELLTTTPRPAWSRAALPAGATAITLASGFGLLVLWGGVQVALGPTAYTHLGWLPISLVGALALVAGALFGMGVARALPSALTPPALVVAGLAATVLLVRHTDDRLPSGLAPNRLSLLSPATPEARQVLLTLSGTVHLGQTIWLLGLLATGFALLVAATPRARLLATVPVLAGAALALLVLPAHARDTYVVDRAAAAPACDGPVCVAQIHRSRLSELAPRGKEALRVLHDALGDRAPDAVREETALRAIGEKRELSGDTVLVSFDDPLIARAEGERLTRVLVSQGLAPHCYPRSERESGTQHEVVVQSIAASWALGESEMKPLEKPEADEYSRKAWKEAEVAWQRLTALPPAEQRARIARMRAAALSCSYDQLDILKGDASR
ncbi:hypothetical protein V1L54_26895 [Streptomyces sp. TRM 70361]|uniref:hypothetical protein n=1 Tax=Streptomyces sp. TRM 70361 TaxID=3116553 RepID=UPI002E7B9E12|nr:hypothetical protein [Streptomyces sp. TRM 70361]MEE1942993.1 hypothetical protein [Streptomyces sp. TRM 70361]